VHQPSEGPGLSKPEPAERRFTSAPPAPGLHLVATPIGNLGDVSLRALAVLRGADRIWCEDTRITARLLTRYGIKTPLAPYHDHNAEAARPAILAALRRGERVALVSDAGTPLVSDPGYKLVRAAIAENVPVTAVPGASAVLTALILSGLPPDRFLFAGFLPRHGAARRRALASCAPLDLTLIFYEAPPRLAAALADMAEILGARPAAVARELTKLHEEVRRGHLAELADHYRTAGPPRGETVIVVGPPEAGEPPDDDDVARRLKAAVAELGVRNAAAKLAAETGLPRSLLYRRGVAILQNRR
jgi:16S rRNA (cytidine1402-2'-O)-methyltransferase